MPTAITHEPIFNTPASSTNTAVVRWSGTTGSTLQDCGVLIDGSNNITGVAGLTATQVDITAQGDLRLQDTTGGQHVALQANGTTTTHTLTFPAAQGSASTVLTNDGAGALTWAAAAAASAITREGGNLTEATTTSSSAVDLMSVTSLTIDATESFFMLVPLRRSAAGSASAGAGLKLNSTVTVEARANANTIWVTGTQNEPQDGISGAFIGPRVTNYLRCGGGFTNDYTSDSTTIRNWGDARPLLDADAPTAEITTVIIRGLANSCTMGCDDLHVYSLAAS
jgi:hypothetical protein